ncbi:MAG: carboxypeptidase regulatory-like domain-containing protein [Myxococcota bacterium]
MSRRVRWIGLCAVLGGVVLWWQGQGEELRTESPPPVVSAPEVIATPDLAGAVVDRAGGRGVAGVEVQLTCSGEVQSAVTEDDGAFVFETVSEGVCALDVQSQAYLRGGPSGGAPVEVTFEGEPLEEVELRVSRSAQVTGQVLGPSGPLSDVTLTLLYLEAPGESEVFSVTIPTRTNDKGHFDLKRLLPGRMQVLAEHDEHGFTETESFYLQPGGTLHDLTIHLVAGGTVLGRVSDASGRALEGAVVRIVTGGTARPRTTESESDGAFLFEGVPPGRIKVTARLAGWELAAPIQVQVETDADVEVTLKMREVDGILGLVLTPEGEPAAYAAISLRGADGRWRRRPVTRSDRQGRFVLPSVRELPIALRASHTDHGPSTLLEVTRFDDEPTLQLTAGGRLVGRVVDSAGRPVRVFTVIAKPEGSKRGGKRRQIRSGEGKFELRSMAPGPYTVRVVPPGLLPAEVAGVEVVANEVADAGTIRCDGGGAAVGRLVDDATGEPVQGVVRVTFKGYGRGAEGAYTRTDADGNFRIEGLRAQRLTLRASAKGYRTRMVSGIDPVEGDELELGEIRLSASEPGRRQLEYSGIGAQLRKTSRGIEFLRVFEDTPTADLGIAKGTVILGINGQDAEELDLRRAVELIRGETGTEIELLIVPPGSDHPESVVIERRDVVAG